jgi:S1-C subfamily serine protease
VNSQRRLFGPVSTYSFICILSAFLPLACMIQPPPSVQQHVQYPVVASTETDAYAGTVDNNKLTGTAYVEVVNANTGGHCRGEGHLVSPSADPSCKGGKGDCNLSCDDGRQISCKYQLLTCSSGVGLGQDQDQHWIAFAFSPDIDVHNVRGIAQKLKEYVSNLPEASAQKRTSQGYSIGTGFFVSSDGYLITANHVVADAQEVAIKPRSGDIFPATLVGTDPANDIALLKAKTSANPLMVAPTNDVSVGEDVLTVGYPLLLLEGQQQKATFGHINALSGEHDDIRFLQTDAAVQPGNSGGPLLDEKGRVIGVIAGMLDPLATLKLSGAMPQNVNYAIKGDYILPILSRYEVGGLARPASASGGNNSEIIRRVRNSVVLVIAK